MKVRPESVAGARVSCPVCRSPVAVERNADVRSPEFRATMAQDSDRQTSEVTRRKPAEELQRDEEFIPGTARRAARDSREFDGSSQAEYDDSFLQNLKSTEDHHSGKHVKVKKRRKQGAAPSHRDVLLDWDTVVDELPVAELYSDPWLEPMPIPEEVTREKSRDFVVSEKSEDGQTVRRVKRVRKRRIFTLAQLFFRRLSYGMRVLTVALVAAIGIAGFWWGIKVFRQKFMPVTFEDVVSDSRVDPLILSHADEDGAAKTATAFFGSLGIEAKLPHVRLPDRVRPLMTAWYAKHPDKAITTGEIVSRDKFKSGDAYFVRLEMEVKAPDPLEPANVRDETRIFVVEELTGKDGEHTYLVDWETAVEYCEMSFEEFKLQQPRTPVAFRLKVRFSDYYNHVFTDQKKWQAAELYYPSTDGRKETVFFGYLQRGSKAWEDLSIYTEPGNNASVIIRLRYPDEAPSREQVIIDSLVHDSWFYSAEKPKSQKRPPSQ